MTKPNGSHGSSYFADYSRVRELLNELYTPIEAQEWMTEKQELLNGQSPAQLIADGKTAQVEDLIWAIREGAFL